MLDNLSFGEAAQVTPKKMERKAQTLPAPIAAAYDATPIGEARAFPVSLPEGADPKKIGTRLVSLLKKYAASTGTVAFKASFTLTDDGIVLYWQRKAARSHQSAPRATDPPPMAKPAPREGEAEATLPGFLSGKSALELLAGEGPDFPIQIQKKPKKGER